MLIARSQAPGADAYSSDGVATSAEIVANIQDLLDRDIDLARRYLDRLSRTLAPPAPLAPARGGLAPWQARRMLRHIEDNLARTITVRELASALRLSASYFRRACKRTFGEPPIAVVIGCRLEHAKRLMVETREPLNQIALMCGFSDQAHFGNRFRQRMGTTPLAWRRGLVPSEHRAP